MSTTKQSPFGDTPPPRTPPPLPKRPTGSYSEADGFDVTCVIGRVEFGKGDLTPYEAAFLLIARHDTDGHFTFPDGQGGYYHVTREWECP